MSATPRIVARINALSAVTQSRCEGPDDLAAVGAMLSSASAEDPTGVYWHPGDLIWRYFLLTIHDDPEQCMRLWRAGSEVLGFAWHDPRDGYVDWQAHPRARRLGLDTEMITWALMRHAASQSGKPLAERRPPFTGCCDADTRRQAILERHGFVRDSNVFHHLVSSLRDPLPEPSLPSGFTLRCVAGEHEHANRAAAHQSAFHPSRVTAEHYLRLMRLPGYDRELDVVAVAPDGRIAAFALGWVDPRTGVGAFEPVGAHADFRRMGLGRAVLIEGMRRMQARGCHTAFVMCEGNNAGVNQFYQSTGFNLIRRDFDYVRRERL